MILPVFFKIKIGANPGELKREGRFFYCQIPKYLIESLKLWFFEIFEGLAQK